VRCAGGAALPLRSVEGPAGKTKSRQGAFCFWQRHLFCCVPIFAGVFPRWDALAACGASFLFPTPLAGSSPRRGVSCAFSDNKKRTSTDVRIFSGRDDWIRTSGLFVPNEARYQTVPHPVNTSNIIAKASGLVNHLEKYFSKNVQSARRGGLAAFSRPVKRTFRVAWRFSFYFIVAVGSGAEESWQRGGSLAFLHSPSSFATLEKSIGFHWGSFC
jgi:hypothetical protein